MEQKTKDSKDKQPERWIHPEEAAQAAHHMKMFHKIKQDKDLHKAAKEHVKGEHEALSAVLGKSSDSEKKKAPAKKKETPKAKKK